MNKEKMSDWELCCFFYTMMYKKQHNCLDKEVYTLKLFKEVKQELLKRLSKNSVEEFKKRLVERIEKIKITRKDKTMADQIHNIICKEIIDLINNLKTDDIYDKIGKYEEIPEENGNNASLIRETLN